MRLKEVILSLSDCNELFENDEFPTDRELSKSSPLWPLISELEKITKMFYSEDLKPAIKKLARKRSLKPYRKDFETMLQNSDSSIRMQCDGWMRRLACEEAKKVRWNAACKVMKGLREVMPAIAAFSTGRQ